MFSSLSIQHTSKAIFCYKHIFGDYSGAPYGKSGTGRYAAPVPPYPRRRAGTYGGGAGPSAKAAGTSPFFEAGGAAGAWERARAEVNRELFNVIQ